MKKEKTSHLRNLITDLTKMSTRGHIDLSKFPRIYTFCAGFIQVFILAVVLQAGGKAIYTSFTHVQLLLGVSTNTAVVIGSVQTTYESSTNISPEPSEDLIDLDAIENFFNFSLGYWKPERGNDYFVDSNSVYLLNSNRVLFEYTNPVPPGQSFIFEFALEGEKGGNLSVGRAEFYEVVIGDGDYKTITLKAARNKGGNFEAIEEQNFKQYIPNSNALRPRLTSSALEKGETVEMKLNEVVLKEESKMKVIVRLKNQEFIFVFDLVANWRDLDDFYYGLIDYSKDGENNTGVYWINPDIVPRINP